MNITMITWLTRENVDAFKSIYSDEDVEEARNSLRLTGYSVQDVAYLLAYYYVNGVTLVSDVVTCPLRSEAEVALFEYKVNPNNEEARDNVFNYLLTQMAHKGLELDLNSVVDSGHASDVITPKHKVKAVKGTLTVPPSAVTIDCDAYTSDQTIETVVCNEGLAAIHSRAFKGISTLKEINFNKRLSYIGNEAFYGTGLENVAIPKGVRIIEAQSFGDCKSLESVDFDDGLLFVGREAFRGCTALKGITLPVTVERIDEGAFEGCACVTTYNLSNVQEIGNFCFRDNKSLVEIQIPATVTTMGRRVFEGCDELKILHLPSSIVDFNRDALEGLPKDCKILVHADDAGDVPIAIHLYLRKLKYEVVMNA